MTIGLNKMTIMVFLITIAASFILYKGWKYHNRLNIILGWGGLLLTFPIWFLISGTEFGIVYALTVPSIIILIWVLREQKWQEFKSLNKPESPLQWHAKSLFKHSLWVIYHLVFLLIMSSIIAIALVDMVNLSPIERSTQIAAVIIITPVIWAILSFYHLISINKWLSFISSIFGTIASALYLFV